MIMILLVTPCQRAAECAEALKENTGEEVLLAETLHHAVTQLRAEAYRAVVFDQHLLEAEPDQVENAMQHLGTAVPVQINFAVSGVERVVREVRAALQRRIREQAGARQAATGLLRSELNGTVTALLLQCELAREIPGISPAAAEKMETAYNLVQKLRAQLESGSHERSR
jgi:DNA-binding NtrC family response regulator